MSSKWVIKWWRHLATSTMLLAQELLATIQRRDGSRSFVKETSVLRMSSAAGHWKLTTTKRIIEADPFTTT